MKIKKGSVRSMVPFRWGLVTTQGYNISSKKKIHVNDHTLWIISKMSCTVGYSIFMYVGRAHRTCILLIIISNCCRIWIVGFSLSIASRLYPQHTTQPSIAVQFYSSYIDRKNWHCRLDAGDLIQVYWTFSAENRRLLFAFSSALCCSM